MTTRIFGVLSAILMLVALYMIFLYAGIDKNQGPVYRILYFHIPQAFLSYSSVILLGFGSIMFLAKRDLKWDRFASSAAEFGLLFTMTTIISGMLWAKPVWGKFWVWDARLTLQLVLGLILVAYFMLRAYLPNLEKRATLSCVFGLLALLDIPFNYGAIYWWNTQHPGPVVSPGGGGMDSDMTLTLLASLAAWACLYVYLLRQRLAVAKIEEQVEYLEHVVHAG